jgi:hypothetical protein
MRRINILIMKSVKDIVLKFSPCIGFLLGACGSVVG